MPTYTYTTTNTTTNNWTYKTANNWTYRYATTTTTTSWPTTDCSGYYSWNMPAKEKRINVSEKDIFDLLQGDED